jgi:hypothetical protein
MLLTQIESDSGGALRRTIAPTLVARRSVAGPPRR